MTITDEDIYEYLEHFGVKGQKWGVRKEQKAFKREVKKTLKGKGISTGKISGDFYNSKGERISEDFGKAVLAKAAKTQLFRDRVKVGAIFAGTIGLAVAVKKGVIHANSGKNEESLECLP